MAIIRDRDLLEDWDNIPVKLIKNCIAEHLTTIPRLDLLDRYYKGEHNILKRNTGGLGLPNNRLVSNHAKYITDVAIGYTTGNPVKYEGEKIEPILEVYKNIDIISHDAELAKDLSVFGIGRELYYMSDDDNPIPKVTVIDPRQIFLVVDSSVEYRSLFGVHYYPKRDIDNNVIGYNVFVYTKSFIYHYLIKDLGSEEYKLIDRQSHYFGGIPVVEFWNNEETQGDFEQVMTLIDAYNTLMSDRVNDKEQFVDAILMIMGFSLGDNEEQAANVINMLKKFKVLEVPLDGANNYKADAKWLIKQLNETEVEVLRKAIQNDIFQFTLVPNMSDQHFAGNSSGVALKHKLLSLEQLAINKERYFMQGLRERLKLFANVLAIKGKAVDISDVAITMTRNLPSDDLTTAQMINLLSNDVPRELLIGQLSFVNDVKDSLKKLRKQKTEDIKLQQSAFGMPLGDVNDEETE